MSAELKLTKRQIDKIIGNGKSYKRYTIKKRDGGVRTIYHPSKDLKVLQRWLVEKIFIKYPVSEYSTAYEKGCSIAKNALSHAGNNFILHTDIEKFFESISTEFLKQYLLENDSELQLADIDLICRIVMFRGGLTIGSVTSPCISNRIMYEFDKNIIERISKLDSFTYTRYADDILISSRKFIDKSILEIIDEELGEIGLSRNYEKTYFTSKQYKRQINGIVLDNNSKNLSYGTEKLNELKKEVYKFVINEGEYNKKDRMRLLGKLAYLKSINEKQYFSLVNKYIKYPNGNKLFKTSN